ncbi:type 2 lantibiotic [Pradoshia sp. D12]|uniref:lichenicidin A2 family type 2 lantibiotic n=1 Tax=Bacillaceae TaxID=186817 RepID=UPI0011288768|nr:MULTISPECIES: mersacidin family lantibiotic [Bacillaceae]QFK72957.1 type 2 lantibiotic [Pradoshia sp. D12]TPF71949.1 type 2 lantibiotic [Bacillus sp. D12]
MTNEQKIMMWKNPAMRKEMELSNEHPCGKGFQELSLDEMIGVNGASEYTPNAITTPVCVVTIPVSVKYCVPATISATASAISGIVTFNKGCLG